MSGIIDIVCNLYTPRTVAEGRTGLEDAFKDQARMPEDMRGGVGAHWYPYGRGKVMFGTDWPVIDTERAVAEVNELDIRPESRQRLLRGNALSVFGLPPE